MLSLLSSLEEGEDDDDEDLRLGKQGKPWISQTMKNFLQALKLVAKRRKYLFSKDLELKWLQEVDKLLAQCSVENMEELVAKFLEDSDILVVFSRKVHIKGSTADREVDSQVFDALLIQAGSVCVCPETDWKVNEALFTELNHARDHGVFVQSLFYFDGVFLSKEDGDIIHGNPAKKSVVEAAMAPFQALSQTGVEDTRQHLGELFDEDSSVVDRWKSKKGRSLDDASSRMLLNDMIQDAEKGFWKEMCSSSFLFNVFSKGTLVLLDFHMKLQGISCDLIFPPTAGLCPKKFLAPDHVTPVGNTGNEAGICGGQVMVGGAKIPADEIAPDGAMNKSEVEGHYSPFDINGQQDKTSMGITRWTRDSHAQQDKTNMGCRVGASKSSINETVLSLCNAVTFEKALERDICPFPFVGYQCFPGNNPSKEYPTVISARSWISMTDALHLFGVSR